MTEYLDEVPHETSVKKLRVLEMVTPQKAGLADFDFMPVFSAFDYGTMQPEPGLDNSTICLMGGFNFELLEAEGLPSHYKSLVDDDGNEISAMLAVEKGIKPTKMRIDLVNRINPEKRDGQWDYSVFENPPVKNYVLPAEFMSRNSLPESSSVWRRKREGKITLEDLGIPEDHKIGEPLPNPPVLDYSTKFEPEDRYLSPEEAQKILRVGNNRFRNINGKTRRASEIMTDYAKSRGFERLDGKVEYLVIDDEVRFGDVVCTWHEDKLIGPGGTAISKQIMRDKLIEINPKWYDEINRAKEATKDDNRDFRDEMDKDITYKLPNEEFFGKVNDLFRAATNLWVGNEVYKVYPDKNYNLTEAVMKAEEEFATVAARK